MEKHTDERPDLLTIARNICKRFKISTDQIQEIALVYNKNGTRAFRLKTYEDRLLTTFNIEDTETYKIFDFDVSDTGSIIDGILELKKFGYTQVMISTMMNMSQSRISVLLNTKGAR